MGNQNLSQPLSIRCPLSNLSPTNQQTRGFPEIACVIVNPSSLRAFPPNVLVLAELIAMKVIVTGSNGLVGSALVRQCAANDKITRVFALTRKSLPDDVAKNPKVAVVLHDDFSTYPPELLGQLAGAEGCLWCAIHPPVTAN